MNTENHFFWTSAFVPNSLKNGTGIPGLRIVLCIEKSIKEKRVCVESGIDKKTCMAMLR